MDCWHRKLDQARTEAEVASEAADFLALWAPSELEPLTLGWREVRVETADDVARVRGWFLESAGAGDAGTRLHELAGYFWHAAERIERIRRAPH